MDPSLVSSESSPSARSDILSARLANARTTSTKSIDLQEHPSCRTSISSILNTHRITVSGGALSAPQKEHKRLRGKNRLHLEQASLLEIPSLLCCDVAK